MAIVDLDVIDKKIADQQMRLDDRPEKEDPIAGMRALPWSMKMKEAFEKHIGLSLKCGACNWLNPPKNKLVLISHIPVMREQLPIPTIVCRQCGSMFVPKWARDVLLQAISAEKQLMKQREAGAQPSEELSEE